MVSRYLTKDGTFFGWRTVALAAITSAVTGPGQTIGISVFIDHFMDDLGIGRFQVATAYLVGTLAVATVLPTIGHRIDRFGVRRAMKWIAIAFGIALVGMSGVTGLISLTIGFFAIRLLGQGSLTLGKHLVGDPLVRSKKGHRSRDTCYIQPHPDESRPGKSQMALFLKRMSSRRSVLPIRTPEPKRSGLRDPGSLGPTLALLLS